MATPIESATFTERTVTQLQDDVRVTVAVPGAAESETLTGLDLYSEGIQPVWLQVENRGEKRIRAALWSVDAEYYSPMEIAWKYRKPYSDEGRVEMERWFYENQMPRIIPPGETRSGFVFTHMTTGTKGFNFDVFANDRSYNFTFFVPVPGFRADYMDVNFQELYEPDEIQVLNLDELRAALQALPCCSTDSTGNKQGDPFNVAFVGSAVAVRRGLLRGDWQETASNSADTEVAREHRYRSRQPDGTFHKSRPDGSERKELRLWLSPLRLGDQPVWLGQASYDMGGGTGLLAREKYRIDPDVDDARMFVMQNFWYSQSLAKMGFVGGVPPATINNAHRNFNDSEYFTDGLRVVLFISGSPVALDETVLLPWTRLEQE
jgi:hypothetical protein